MRARHRFPVSNPEPSPQGGAMWLGLLLLLLACLALAWWWHGQPPAPPAEVDAAAPAPLERQEMASAADAAPPAAAAEALAAVMAVDEGLWPLLRAAYPQRSDAVLEDQFRAASTDPHGRLQVSRLLTNGAIHLSRDGRLDEAIRLLQEAQRFDADGGMPAAWWARLLLRQGRRADAETVVAEARAQHPQAVVLLRLAAEIARLKGQDQEVVELLTAAQAQDPAAPGLKEELARAVEEQRAMATFLTDASAHFDLRYDPAASALVQAMPTLARVVEEAWQDVLQGTGITTEQRVVVIFLDPHRYQAGAPDWSSGLYDGRVRLVVEDPQDHVQELARTLRHELTHAALFTLGSPLPTWLHEGLAQEMEGADPDYARAALASLARLQLNANDLAGDWTSWSDRERVREAYFYSLSLTDWIGHEYGAGIWPNLFQNLKGRAFEAAWMATFGLSFAEVDARHRRQLF